MKNTFAKTLDGRAAPFGDNAVKAWGRVKSGDLVEMDWHKIRNPKFHRKFFALLNFAFDHWEAPKGFETEISVTPQKNFEQFREDAIILAGFYEVYWRLDGTFRTKAKSISFASMEEDEFEELYNKVINVILAKVLVNYDREELDRVVDELINFM